MNNKLIFIVGSALLTLVSCGDPKPYINLDLVHDGAYYTYKVEGKISKGTRYRFTATKLENYHFTYFGMSQYSGDTPYFDIGYIDNTKTVNVTNIYKVVGENKTALTSKQIGTYGPDLLVMNNNLFDVGNQIIIECTITKDLSLGIWAYVGTYPEP